MLQIRILKVTAAKTTDMGKNRIVNVKRNDLKCCAKTWENTLITIYQYVVVNMFGS